MATRREILAGVGLAVGGGTVALAGDHVAENYKLQDPIDIDLRSPLTKKRDNGKTPVDNHSDFEGGDPPSNVEDGDNNGNGERYEDDDSDSTPWFETYDVGDFTEDLYNESDYSVAVTNDFLLDAYEEGGEEIYRALVEDDELKVNDSDPAHLYNDTPGLGYSEDFGGKVETLSREDELEELLEDYVEEELG